LNISASEKSFMDEARRIGKEIADAEKVYIFTHIDADGISAGAVALETVRRLSIPAEIDFLKKLDDQAIELIRSREDGIVWMCDLGSGYISRFGSKKMVIADHHHPEADIVIEGKGQTRLAESNLMHLNAHLFGIDGATEVCSATTSYFIARSLSERNRDLSPIALTGAVGDLQDSRYGKLTGLNRFVLDEASEAGLVHVIRDARFYGKETRALPKLLEFSVDPEIPGISGDPEASESMLQALGVEWKRDGKDITWNELSSEERVRIMSHIVQRMIASGISPDKIRAIVGETYLIDLPGWDDLPKDMKEFATLLNACGRYESYLTGVELCVGDRRKATQDARLLLENHRRNISQAIKLVRECGLEKLKNVQYFHLTDRAPDTIVGTVAGILMKSRDTDDFRVVVGFACSEGKIKVSCRGNTDLVSRGLDLALSVRAASEKLGGIGGGHSIAAGATIDAGKEMDFLRLLDEEIEKQLSEKN